MSEEDRNRRRRALPINSDAAFDRLVPPELKHLSAVHWTPSDVAIRVAALFSPQADERVLDVGSGIGKLCITGALSSPGTWVGVELSESLVLAARKLAGLLGVTDRAEFIHGDAFDLDWTGFDALYLYNPFEVSLTGPTALTDGELAYQVNAARTAQRLAQLRPGARVITLNGFGALMPSTFRLLHRELLPRMQSELAMWRQGELSVSTRQQV